MIVLTWGWRRPMRGFVSKPVELPEQRGQRVPSREIAGDPPGPEISVLVDKESHVLGNGSDPGAKYKNRSTEVRPRCADRLS